MNDKEKKKEFLENAPEWVMGINSINEIAYGTEYLKQHPMICINDKLFDVDGEADMKYISYRISQDILPYVRNNLSNRVKSLIEAVKLLCYGSELPLDEFRIHLKNGTLDVDGSFTEEKYFCRNRLDVEYREFIGEAYYPEKFLTFLYDLLEPEDVETLQEYLGYCLIPSTKGQKMMFIVGNGGEGKSRIGVVLQSIFEKNMLTGSFQRIESDRFFRYNLQDKLLMVDDDMQMNALTSTGYIKNLITAETPVDVEAKGEQSYQAKLYARFLCFGNGSPKALYDKTDGFARRLIILTTKPKSENRIDDPFIAERFIAEKEKIFRWMFDGLKRLIDRKFRFTISNKTRLNITEAMSDNCNITEFLSDGDIVSFNSDFCVTGAELYSVYSIWCGDNALTALKRDTFISWLKTNQKKFGIHYDSNIIDDREHRVRGFKGIKINKKLTCLNGV